MFGSSEHKINSYSIMWRSKVLRGKVVTRDDALEYQPLLKFQLTK